MYYPRETQVNNLPSPGLEKFSRRWLCMHLHFIYRIYFELKENYEMYKKFIVVSLNIYSYVIQYVLYNILSIIVLSNLLYFSLVFYVSRNNHSR